MRPAAEQAASRAHAFRKEIHAAYRPAGRLSGEWLNHHLFNLGQKYAGLAIVFTPGYVKRQYISLQFVQPWCRTPVGQAPAVLDGKTYHAATRSTGRFSMKFHTLLLSATAASALFVAPAMAQSAGPTAGGSPGGSDAGAKAGSMSGSGAHVGRSMSGSGAGAGGSMSGSGAGMKDGAAAAGSGAGGTTTTGGGTKN